MKPPRTWAVMAAVAALLALAFGLWYNAPSQRQARADAHLRNAILHNDTRGVVNALAQGANPNATFLFPTQGEQDYEQGLTLWQRVKNMFRHDPSAPADPPIARAPLSLAIAGAGGLPLPPENPVIVEALLRRGANPNVVIDPGPYWLTLFDQAIWNGKAQTVDLMLQYGANINAKDNVGNTPIDDAAGAEQCLIVETLLAHGADVNSRGMFRRTPLMMAVEFAGANFSPPTGVQMVQLLLRHHADVMAQDKFGETALIYAQRMLPHFPRRAPTLGPIIALLQSAQAKAQTVPGN